MGGVGTDIGRVTNQPVFDFIEKNRDNPFFIWYAPQLPHYPFDAPEKYTKLYEGRGFSKSAVLYYANCTWFDDAVGELIKYFKTNSLYKNTLFIYVNDNGWEQEPEQEFFYDPIRSHNGGDKGKLSIYDQSFRTPIIFSWKNHIKSSVRKPVLIHSTDIPATILDYVGLMRPKDYDGVSYKDVIEGKKHGERSLIIGNSNKIRDNKDPMGRDVETYWIRNKEWFFNWNITDKTKSLYNVNTDPFCNNDQTIENPDIITLFLTTIKQWRNEKKEFLKTL